MGNQGLVSENSHRKQRRRNVKLDFWKPFYWMHPNTPHGALLIIISLHTCHSQEKTETSICIWHVSSNTFLPRGCMSIFLKFIVELFLVYEFNNLNMIRFKGIRLVRREEQFCFFLFYLITSWWWPTINTWLSWSHRPFLKKISY